MKKIRKQKFLEDDGRVIAGMNVDGMPWYINKKTSDMQNSAVNQEPITIKETIHLIFGALGAALLIGGAFGLAGFIFIIFCRFVWLR